MLFIAIPVDPRKDAKSKWLFWVIGPMVCTALFAIATYGSIKNPGWGDLIGVIAFGALLTYITFGGVYLRKRWPVGRWPGSRS
jgi:hypothetical protein